MRNDPEAAVRRSLGATAQRPRRCCTPGCLRTRRSSSPELAVHGSRYHREPVVVPMAAGAKPSGSRRFRGRPVESKPPRRTRRRRPRGTGSASVVGSTSSSSSQCVFQEPDRDGPGVPFVATSESRTFTSPTDLVARPRCRDPRSWSSPRRSVTRPAFRRPGHAHVADARRVSAVNFATEATEGPPPESPWIVVPSRTHQVSAQPRGTRTIGKSMAAAARPPTPKQPGRPGRRPGVRLLGLERAAHPSRAAGRSRLRWWELKPSQSRLSCSRCPAWCLVGSHDSALAARRVEKARPS